MTLLWCRKKENWCFAGRCPVIEKGGACFEKDFRNIEDEKFWREEIADDVAER